MLKRIIFYSLMLIFPATFGVTLFVGYKIYHRYHDVAAQQQTYQTTLKETIKSTAQSQGSLVDLVGPALQDYADNWASAMSFVPIPGVSANFMPNVRGKYVNTNDLGYRSTINYRAQIVEAKRFRAEGKKVVVYTGGSAAFGLYSDDDTSDVVGYLNAMSAAKNGNLIFYNFAMGSYTSLEELNALVTYAVALNPDLLIVFDGLNDAFRLTVPDTYNVGIGIPFTYLAIRQAYPTKFSSDWLDRTYDISALSPVDEKEFFEYYSRNLRLMARIMKSIGGGTVLATQPVAILKNPCYAGNYRPIDINLQRVMPMIATSARDVAKQEEIPYLDLTSVFDENKERCRGSFVDTVHMSSSGQKIIAEKLYEAATMAIQSLSTRRH